MAEVAVPRQLFAGILRLVVRPRAAVIDVKGPGMLCECELQERCVAMMKKRLPPGREATFTLSALEDAADGLRLAGLAEKV